VSWNHNSHYHDMLLREVPSPCGPALDVGCGEGDFSRLLAARAQRVDAIDMDEGVIRRAREEAAMPRNLSFIPGNFLAYPVAEDAYDFVCALAALHHMPLEPAVAKMRRALRPGGVLAVLGVWPVATPTDMIISSAAVVVNLGYRTARGRDRMGAPTANPTMTLDEVRARIPDLLPGATVRRHLLWRYTIIWRKPAS
jgi:SAM-dependent methyltransferase